MCFANESDFEYALIESLKTKGWNKNVIMYPTEEDLIQNWMNILYDTNCDRDHLNHVPLSRIEMQQILDKISELNSPMAINTFINGRTVTITRDEDSKDIEHRGKEVSLKIYDRQEIAGGTSRYQIVEQPQFEKRKSILPNRRGDIMLLINGMPVIHIELKKSGVPVSEACHQIEKYAHEDVFTGLYSLVLVFFAMNPEETLYFANPGKDQFNPAFFFHWADFNNEPINAWNDITRRLLSIPEAHKLIGFYTVADRTDGTLKVLRPYQIYATWAIAERVMKADWTAKHEHGGYIFATTGSGKSLTSFKAAQLISAGKDADKVIFLLDRVELGTQSLDNYRNFATPLEEIQETEDTHVLLNKLKSSDASDALIVTSIQKMSRIKENGLSSVDLSIINKKRIVIIVDECHRDTFGKMIGDIKRTFSNAMFFGFTGTPIYIENGKKGCITADVFGDELHRYSIADGIRDKNVLGFDVIPVHTFSDNQVREQIALYKCKSSTVPEALADPEKKKIYLEWYGKQPEELERELPESQYKTAEHRFGVVRDIKDNWYSLSLGTFHALFATSSIIEAIEYYRLFKREAPELRVTALFDPNIDNTDDFEFKEDGLVEIYDDYNKRYAKAFSLSDSSYFKKDIANRLAHKKQYRNIKDNDVIDILIVVDQMLTGFDSKWINTLYLDKQLKYEQVIQAFSRTNRLFDDEKPFGIIKYYRRPYQMKRQIAEAVRIYSGERKFDIFVDKLPANIRAINTALAEISTLFEKDTNFSRLPTLPADIGKFVLAFNHMQDCLTAAKIQGLKWDNPGLNLTETVYNILVQRYKEISKSRANNEFELPYTLKSHVTAAQSLKINVDYMNSNFSKFIKLIEIENADPDEINAALEELNSSFAILPPEEQKIADSIITEIRIGTLKIKPGETIRDLITEQIDISKAKNIQQLHDAFGVDMDLVRNIINSDVTEANINEYGRLDRILNTIDIDKAKAFFADENIKSEFRIRMKVKELIKEFVLSGGFDIKENSAV